MSIKVVERAPQSTRRIYGSSKSLSSYFPRGTQYYYGYPAGESTDFINHVSPHMEELIAARAFSCAGPDVSVVAFADTCSPRLSPALLKAFNIPQLRAEQVILLPQTIDTFLTGLARNQKIKASLLKSTTPGMLVMAQPFMDPALTNHFQISPSLTNWLNDKGNLSNLIAEVMLPKRLAFYASSQEFIANYNRHTLPYVVKASSSSAGDGVHICRSAADLKRAIKQFSNINTTIMVEQYINARKNYGIHFGIPYDNSKPIDIIGFNEQITNEHGKFLGGIVESSNVPQSLVMVSKYLRNKVLPNVRKMGWYGVGCFDVLLDEYDNPYFIDGNFRMTGMSAYHFMAKAQKITLPVITFTGSFNGTQREFEQALSPIAGVQAEEKILQLITLNQHGGKWSFNAAAVLPDHYDRFKTIEDLLALGIESPGLEQLVNSAALNHSL